MELINSRQEAHVWQKVGEAASPNWYLDPVVARQKSQVHADFVRECVGDCSAVATVLKTDLFEEAFGEDVFFPAVFPNAKPLTGMDISAPTAAKAGARFPALGAIVADVRRLAIATGSIEVVVSNSTLDHFDTEAELHQSLDELLRILRPGGRLVLTLDNPKNPLYPVLRWLSRHGYAPFPLGATMSIDALVKRMREQGHTVTHTGWLIHNPRLISTLMFMVLRRLFGKHADRPIGGLLAAFALLGKLPTRRFTSCFYGICVCGRNP